jgi:hypothetical protein
MLRTLGSLSWIPDILPRGIEFCFDITLERSIIIKAAQIDDPGFTIHMIVILY